MVMEGEMSMTSLLMLLTIKFLLVMKSKKIMWSKRHNRTSAKKVHQGASAIEEILSQ